MSPRSKTAAGVGQARVQEEREEVVAQVVVGGDVARAAAAVVAPQGVRFDSID